MDVSSPEYLFLAIESGIVTKEGSPAQDVCYVAGERGTVVLDSFSYPIEIPVEWYEKWIASGPIEHPLGFTTTFGDFVEGQIEGVDTKNWMAHPSLGGHDRNPQIQDALTNLLGKFMIESKISYFENFPKPNVTFKDLSNVVGDPELLRILVKNFQFFKINFLD